MPTKLLTDLIRVLPPSRPATPEPEDIFASAPLLIFNDVRTEHGDASSTIVYTSARFGDVKLRMADPEGESERRLFGHYLWNASIKLAELVGGNGDGEPDAKWNVIGERVLELGSGVGLGGIVAALAGAEEVTLSDYPSPPLISNLTRNLHSALPPPSYPHCTVQPHTWGDFTSIPFPISHKHHYTRILAADCLWMPEQHLPLVQSMLYFLTLSPESRVFCLAGFHTGRKTLAEFFRVADGQGLVVDEIYEEDVEGRRRAWREKMPEGEVEDVFERKRWLVVARLKRR